MVRPNQDRSKPGEHVDRRMGWWTDSRRRPGCPPQGSRRLCRRGSSSETGNRAGQAKGRTLCGRVSARRSIGAPTRFVGSWRAPCPRTLTVISTPQCTQRLPRTAESSPIRGSSDPSASVCLESVPLPQFTPSAPSSASLAMSAHRPSMNSIQGNGSTLHVVGECVNQARILA